MVFADHSAAGDVDWHSAAGSGFAADTDYDSIDWVVPETSARSLVASWHVDEYCSQRLVPEASSSWPPSPCACCQ